MRAAVRSLLRDPKFTFFAVLVLGFGIGASTAVFSMINGVLLRALPYRNPGNLVWIWSTRVDRDKAFFSIPNFIDTRDQTKTLADISAFANWNVNLTGNGDAERLLGVRVSANTFQMLGVTAIQGRTLATSDGLPSSDATVVLSHGLWQRRFAGRTDVVGKKVLLNGQPYTVAGILPSTFIFPGAEPDVISVLVFETDPRRTERGSNFLRVFGRLEDGVRRGHAQAELTAITERLRDLYPDDNGKHTPPRVIDLSTEILGGYSRLLWTLFGAVSLVLVVASANLANLFVARSIRRRKDLAIRMAIGANQSEILRHILSEVVVIALAGGLLGILSAFLLVRAAVGVIPVSLPRLGEVTVDHTVLGFAVFVSFVSAGLIGLAPGFSAMRANINEQLRGLVQGSASRVFGLGTRKVLAIAEVAGSLVLIIVAGLLVRSFIALQEVEIGFDSQNLLLTTVSLPAPKYVTPASVNRFIDELRPQLVTIRGVRSVGFVSVLPLSGMNTRTDFKIEGRVISRPEEMPAAQNRWISPDYFQTMGLPMRRGREFSAFDRAEGPPVVIVDEALAGQYFQDGDAVGQNLVIDFGEGHPRMLEVVGVVGNVKHFGLDEPPTPTLYAPMAQAPQPVISFLTSNVSVVIRTLTDPQAAADDARRAISNTDSNVPASGIRTMDQLLASAVSVRRFNVILMESFAAAGLFLTAIGLYGVLSYVVALRRREIGVRMAIGARRADVIRLIMTETFRLTAAGIVIGLASARLLTRLLTSLLFNVSVDDPVTLLIAISLMAVVTAGAAYLPARRASRVDPTQALRSD